MTTGRNAPCTCGSGKKYKQCCGRDGQAAVAPSGGTVQAALQQARQFFQNGALQQTEILCRKLLAAQPDNPDANHLLGQLAHRVGKLEDARRLIGQAVSRRPGNVVFRLDLANVLFDLGNFQDAIKEAQEALKREPDSLGARFTLALALRSLGRLEEAIAEYRKLLARHPQQLAVLQNLGVTLKEAGKLDEALGMLGKALQVQPDSALIHCVIGVILKLQGHYENAAKSLENAIRLDPNMADAHSNLGVVLQIMGATALALQHHARAIALAPGFAQAHWGMAPALLAAGNLAPGWEKYDWRLSVDGFCRTFPQAWWQGEPLAGKTLLIWGEQGVGDEILFAQGIADAIQAGARVIVECEARLAPLFSRSFPGIAAHGKENPPHARLLQADIDYQIPMGSLARWYRPTLESFPAHQGYLIPAPERVEHWKDWLASLGPGPKVGISWRSMKRGAGRDNYYTELSQWGEILATPGAVFVNLQYGECSEELEQARQLFGVEIRQAPGLNLKDQLDDVAALTKALDLVIGPKTSVTAMAGAVGVPTWLLNSDSDWSMLGTDRMPWFPSVKVYRKCWGDAWEPLLAQVAGELNELTKKGTA